MQLQNKLERKEMKNLNNIKQLRSAANMTLRELAEKARTAISYISTLENDSTGSKNPSKNVMERIAKALDSTVPKIFY